MKDFPPAREYMLNALFAHSMCAVLFTIATVVSLGKALDGNSISYAFAALTGICAYFQFGFAYTSLRMRIFIVRAEKHPAVTKAIEKARASMRESMEQDGKPDDLLP